MIRVLIVDDSRVVREVIKDLLEGTDVQVVGEASNGKEAIELTKKLAPDLITMDVMMPVMDGLSAVEHIMAYTPTPILVLASSINRKDVNIAFEAIQLGALDVMEKPENLSREGFGALRDTLLQKIRLLSNIKVISHIKGKRKFAQPTAPKELPKAKEPLAGILAIGASTGGPRAVMSILKALPADFPLGAALVQHIGASFTPGFVDWLAQECKLKVKLAKDGDAVTPGTVLVGPGNLHMEIEENVVRLSDTPPVNNCKPSVDVLFKSVARSYGSQALAVLLTGMGRDGAEGMVDIKKMKGLNIVQDEKTSVIFGMPKAAIELGVVDKVVPLNEIPNEIMRIVRNRYGKDSGN